MKTIVLSPGIHRGREIIKIDFEYDTGLLQLVKNFDGAK